MNVSCCVACMVADETRKVGGESEIAPMDGVPLLGLLGFKHADPYKLHPARVVRQTFTACSIQTTRVSCLPLLVICRVSLCVPRSESSVCDSLTLFGALRCALSLYHVCPTFHVM